MKPVLGIADELQALLDRRNKAQLELNTAQYELDCFVTARRLVTEKVTAGELEHFPQAVKKWLQVTLVCEPQPAPKDRFQTGSALRRGGVMVEV